MYDTLESAYREEWGILNGANGLLTTVTIGGIETHGRIAFAACLVMSRQRWQEDQVELRRESLKIRRAEEERVREKVECSSNGHQVNRKRFNDRQHRETLKLPIDGKLAPHQINAAYRRLAQKAHPDVGGSNELFVRITEARNALLEYIS